MSPARNEKGMVLLLVLVVVALLTSLVTEFAFSTLVDMRLTETFRDSTRAWYLAKGGVEAGKMILQENAKTNQWDHPDELWGIGVPSYPVGEEGVVSISIEDLSARVNLNNLVDSFQTLDIDTASKLYRLFTELGLPDSADLTAAVIDWIDSDSDMRTTFTLDDGSTINAEGAEDNYYQGLDRPYQTKNMPLDTLDELTLIRGFTTEVYRQVLPFLTIFGDKRINLNTASAEVLMAADEEIDRSAAEEIILRRADRPFEQTIEVNAIPRLELLVHTKFSTKGSMFQITSQAAVNDGTRRAVAVVSSDGKKVHYMKVD